MVLHVSCAGLEASLESVASSPCASYKLYKCSVFPHCCPFYLLILTDLLLNFDSLGETEVAVAFCACAIFVELDIFVLELAVLYQITVEVASQTISNSDRISCLMLNTQHLLISS